MSELRAESVKPAPSRSNQAVAATAAKMARVIVRAPRSSAAPPAPAGDEDGNHEVDDDGRNGTLPRRRILFRRIRGLTNDDALASGTRRRRARRAARPGSGYTCGAPGALAVCATRRPCGLADDEADGGEGLVARAGDDAGEGLVALADDDGEGREGAAAARRPGLRESCAARRPPQSRPRPWRSSPRRHREPRLWPSCGERSPESCSSLLLSLASDRR